MKEKPRKNQERKSASMKAEGSVKKDGIVLFFTHGEHVRSTVKQDTVPMVKIVPIDIPVGNAMNGSPKEAASVRISAGSGTPGKMQEPQDEMIERKIKNNFLNTKVGMIFF